MWVSVYLAKGGQMLVAYLDEVAEAGAFVSKTHKNYNGSPAFGYAGFVIPSDQVRVMSQYFTEKKRRLFAHLIPSNATAVSMGGSNELVECFCGGAVAEGGSGAVVELVGDGVEVGLVAGDGGSFG